MKPVYKIETYTAAVLDHTITSSALNINVKHSLTDAVGSFRFTVPTRTAGSYIYDDIALHDKVKIYLGYDSVGATPDFIGYVDTVPGTLSTPQGYVREVSGLCLGEVLLRRLKTNASWSSTAASTIVTALATDLSLGTGEIATETITEDIEVETESYFDLLQRVSDYWKDGSNKVKYDFYVDVDGDLVWHARPIRTAGVEALSVGTNILHYNVHPDVDQVGNNITVYGKAAKTNPANSDGWTESTAGWTSDGTLTADLDEQVGTYSIKATKSSTQNMYLDRDIDTFSCRWPKEFKTMNFWWKVTDSVAVPTYWVLHLYAPDNSNYFLYGVALPKCDEWIHFTAPVGPDASYGYYRGTVGAPSWEQITYLHFYVAAPTNRVFEWFLDAFHFAGQRYSGSASDLPSAYEQRDLEIIDDNLTSDAMCTQRAEKLLYQMKDPPVQITVTTFGNTNILVGDRLSMTIPAEGIAAASYDVFQVEHSLSADRGFVTKAVMVDSENVRKTAMVDMVDALVRTQRQVRAVSRGVRRVR